MVKPHAHDGHDVFEILVRENADMLSAYLRSLLDNSWADTARSIIGNWTGLVYQLTNVDRKVQFMDGVDPDDPLGSV